MFYAVNNNFEIAVAGCCAAFILTYLFIRFLGKRLPKDQGREYAVAGKLSEGKIRGAGLLFITVFVLVSTVCSGFSISVTVYNVLIFASMMSGYLDDRSETPWGETIKGVLDLIICILMSVAIVHFEPGCAVLDFVFCKVEINKIVYVILATIFLWLMINAVNCADGIDGLSSGLVINSMLAASLVSPMLGRSDIITHCAIMTAVLLAYLVFNTEPSSVLMGDAGSRALGLFLGLIFLRMGNALIAIPLCIVLLADGLLGLVKVSAIRYLKLKNFMANIRTPLHDHLRKNKGASNAQVRFRFNLAQIVVSFVFICVWLLVIAG